MTPAIDLPPTDLTILRQILRDRLPPGTDVWAFGSRVHGTSRRYSDLDLALQCDTPLDWGVLAALDDALSESDLTIKVDLVDLRAVDEAFRRIIESQMVRLSLPGPEDDPDRSGRSPCHPE